MQTGHLHTVLLNAHGIAKWEDVHLINREVKRCKWQSDSTFEKGFDNRSIQQDCPFSFI